MKKAIVIGAGMCGCTAAFLLKKAGWAVTVFERSSVSGAGVRTYVYGGHPYTFGPRPLYTPHDKVYNYLKTFLSLEPLELYLDSYVESDRQFYSYPAHEDDIEQMPDREVIHQELRDRPDIREDMNFEEYYQASMGPTLYNKFVNHYSKKMWDVSSNTQLTDFAWSLKGAVLQKGSRQVRSDLIIAHPVNRDGYNPYFTQLEHALDIHFNTPIETFDLENTAVCVDGRWERADILVSTTSVDLLMGYCYGPLRYIGRDFLKIVLPVEQVIPDPVSFLYYSGEEPYTRIVEYKKLYRYTAPTTLLGIEIPSHKNKLYPYPIKSERERAQRYLDDLPDNVFSMGRMGKYKYDNIGDVIMEGFDLVDQLEGARKLQNILATA